MKGDLERIRLMKDCNWKPANQYWKEKYGVSQVNLYQLIRVAGSVLRHDKVSGVTSPAHKDLEDILACYKK